MLITSARAAGPLSASIDALTAQIAALNAAISDGAIIASGSLVINDPVVASGNTTITIRPQTVAESAAVFSAMITILQARLDALNASLAALP